MFGFPRNLCTRAFVVITAINNVPSPLRVDAQHAFLESTPVFIFNVSLGSIYVQLCQIFVLIQGRCCSSLFRQWLFKPKSSEEKHRLKCNMWPIASATEIFQNDGMVA